MRFISTRQRAEEVGLGRAILDGIAPDGGLYVPANVPFFNAQELADLSDAKMGEFAFAILKRFVGDEVSDTALIRMITEAYASFKHPSVAPLVEVGHNRWIMELFHGPTLAFVRHQSFWNQWQLKLRESLAHLVGFIMRRAGGDASVALRVSFV